MLIAHIRFGLVAAVALAALPASAATNTFPGTQCTSDGPVGRALGGLMVNKASALGPGGIALTTYFYCPIVHSQPLASISNKLTISVSVRTNASQAFECWVRSINADNVMFDQVKLVFPGSSGVGYHTTSGAQVSMPSIFLALAPASVNMRCAVPNVAGGVEAGIVSYRVDQ
jgi:hypothetical protein